MIRQSALRCLGAALFALALLVSGCSLGRQSPPVRLYTLTTIPPADAGQRVSHTPGIALGIGPVELPQYVNRPQIVTGDSGNELQRAALEQWAEPLETNFSRVLAQNLALLLATDRVAVFPWKGPVPIDYQVVVEVTQFLGAPNGSVSLVALWRVLGKDGREVLLSQQSSFTESTGSQDYGALAAAMSRTIASLSREIAIAIATLPRQEPRTVAR
ncbi:MAG: membrane integrity-associated transporter subunit PqiC [Candidatus Binatia bacterium]